MDEAKKFAEDIFEEFKDKNIMFWTSPKRCGNMKVYQAICNVLKEEGIKYRKGA